MATIEPVMPGPQEMWRIAPEGSLLTAEFDGQTVIYHTGAGHTHWISAVAAEVLNRLGEGPQNETSLYTALSELVSAENLPLLADSLHQTLEDLKHLALIEPA